MGKEKENCIFPQIKRGKIMKFTREKLESHIEILNICIKFHLKYKRGKLRKGLNFID